MAVNTLLAILAAQLLLAPSHTIPLMLAMALVMVRSMQDLSPPDSQAMAAPLPVAALTAPQ